MEGRRIRITAGDVQVTAALNGSAMAAQVWDLLPIEASCSVWGDEIYFRIPELEPEDGAVEVVDMGAVAYWPPGSALCVFFGRTPASVGDEIRPASAVNVMGTIEGDATALKAARPGERVVVERLE